MTPIAPTSLVTRAAATAALAAALVVVGVAPAAAQGVDLRSPDARDAGTASQPSYVDLRSPDAQDAERAGAQQPPSRGVDLRSPDARDAGRPTATPGVDLRSPDARDAGRPTVTPASPQPAAEPSGPDSDGWLIPALAGAAMALMLATLMTHGAGAGTTRSPDPRLTQTSGGVPAGDAAVCLSVSGCPDLNWGPLRPERSALPGCATARAS
jgi:hypothetical protein